MRLPPAAASSQPPGFTSLRPEDEAAWLDPQLTDAQQVMALVKPYPSECMQAYPVSSLVNSWENEGPELIAAVAPTVQVLE
jgi:putative SOS response-associated peptidase YedK